MSAGVVDAATLARALGHVRPALGKFSTMPVLSFGLLDAGTLTASDLDVTIRASVDYTGPALLLPIAEAVAALKGAKGALTLTPDAGVVRMSGATSGALVCTRASVDEFPNLESVDPVRTIELLDDDRTALKHVTAAASTDDTRPILTGVLLASTGGGLLRWVATDSYRLALCERPTAAREFSSLLPARAIRAALKCGATERLELSARSGVFHGSGVSVEFRLIDGDFPRYENLIPATSTATLTVPAPALLKAAQAAARIGGKRDSTAVLLDQLGSHGCRVSRRIVDVGETSCEVGAPDPNMSAACGFNPTYLADGLAGLTGDVVLSFVDSLKPVTIRAAERPGWTYLVMPVRGDHKGIAHGFVDTGTGVPASVVPAPAPKRVRAPKVAPTTPVSACDAPAQAPAVVDVPAPVPFAHWADLPVCDIVVSLPDREPAACTVVDGPIVQSADETACDLARALEDDPDLFALPAHEVRAILWDRVAAGAIGIDDAMQLMDRTYSAAGAR